VKSLFFRLLVSLWLAMALLVGAFAAIHAWAFPPEAGSLRQKFAARAAEMRGENALLCSRQALDDCARVLRARDARDARLALYEDGKLVIGEPIGMAAELEQTARASADRNAFVVSDNEYGAVVLARDPRFVVAWQGPVWSRWVFFIAPDTLPYRLLAIVLVTGLVAVLLARYLSRPIARLRRATQQIAAGDLSVRVADQLAGADSETRALGLDLDAMAERIQALLESERRLRRDISHELRSPLTRLNISLELIRRKSSAELAPAFERVERDTARLDEMIRELLHLNRLEAEGLEHAEVVDLAALAGSVVEDGAIEAERQGVRLTLRTTRPGLVRGNRELLRRAIENVVRNAIRFTGEGKPVELELGSGEGLVQLSVRDHGPGVPEESLTRIFKPFYRVEGDRSRNTGGTGLGLSIVEQSMLLHGGRVEARNHDDGGLVVKLELPAAERGVLPERSAPGLPRTGEPDAVVG
jgi:two-component system sensor histidine kinase CpxA